jgi:hypothetical protein
MRGSAIEQGLVKDAAAHRQEQPAAGTAKVHRGEEQENRIPTLPVGGGQEFG